MIPTSIIARSSSHLRLQVGRGRTTLTPRAVAGSSRSVGEQSVAVLPPWKQQASLYHRVAIGAPTSLSLSSSLSFYLQPQQQKSQTLFARRAIFIQTENTPNPESIKFVPTNTVVLDNEDGNGHFLNKTDDINKILKSPLATQLFKIDGVKSVYFGNDFVSITKFAEAKWQLIRPEIFSTLMDFFDNPQNKVLLDQPLITDTTVLDDDDEVVAMIKELIEDRIRPAVQEDGGDIRYKDFDEHTGIVQVELAGSCVGCPSSSITLKQGVENMLMHYIPEVTAVQALEDDPEQSGGLNDIEQEESASTQKTYEERLKAAGIPFSD